MKPVIVSRGFVFIKILKACLRRGAENIVYAALKERWHSATFGELKNCVRSSLEPFLYNKTRRNPIVIPVIINSKSTMAEIEAMRAARNASRAARAKNHGAKEHRRHDKKRHRRSQRHINRKKLTGPLRRTSLPFSMIEYLTHTGGETDGKKTASHRFHPSLHVSSPADLHDLIIRAVRGGQPCRECAGYPALGARSRNQ